MLTRFPGLSTTFTGSQNIVIDIALLVYFCNVAIDSMEIGKLQSVTQFNSQRGQETLHPLVSVLEQSKSKPVHANRYLSDIYIVFLKDLKCEEFHYGRNKYDYQEESLLFISPGQVFGFESGADKMIQPRGWALTFHPDFIKGTSLGKELPNTDSFLMTLPRLYISQSESG